MTIALPRVTRGLGFGEEHRLLQENTRRFVSERFDKAALRRLYDAGGDPALETELHLAAAELGYTALTLGETDGGAGLGELHAALMFEQLGRALFPSPILPSLLAAQALCAGGAAKERWLGGVVGGTITAAFSHGPLTGVAGGSEAALLVARAEDGWRAFDLQDAERREEQGMDLTRRAATLKPHDAGEPLAIGDALLARAFTYHAAECLGAAEQVLTITRDYAIERRQFGRPIGSFQGVSHATVNVMIAVEEARSLVYGAAATLDAEPDAALPYARMALVAAVEALWFAADRGVQLHGGFGFTWECDVHFYYRRALWARGAFGSPEEHKRALAELM